MPCAPGDIQFGCCGPREPEILQGYHSVNQVVIWNRRPQEGFPGQLYVTDGDLDYNQTQFNELISVMLSELAAIEFQNIAIPDNAEHATYYQLVTDDGIGNPAPRYDILPSEDWTIAPSAQTPGYPRWYFGRCYISSWVYQVTSGYARMTEVKKCRYRLQRGSSSFETTLQGTVNGIATPIEARTYVSGTGYYEFEPLALWPSGFTGFVELTFGSPVHQEQHVINITGV